MPAAKAKKADPKGGKSAPAKKKEGSSGGKAKKASLLAIPLNFMFVYFQKKWSKGKVRDRLNNAVLFDKASYEKLYKEVRLIKAKNKGYIRSKIYRLFPLNSSRRPSSPSVLKFAPRWRSLRFASSQMRAT